MKLEPKRGESSAAECPRCGLTVGDYTQQPNGAESFVSIHLRYCKGPEPRRLR